MLCDRAFWLITKGAPGIMKARATELSNLKGGLRTAFLLLSVCCACLNALQPRLICAAAGSDYLRTIMSRQPDLLYCFSLASVPLSIMDGLMNETLPGRPQAKDEKPPVQQPYDQHAVPSADSAFARDDKGETIREIHIDGADSLTNRLLYVSSGRHPPPQSALLSSYYPFRQAQERRSSRGVLFFLLPRSSVNEDAVTIISCMRAPAGDMPAGFFICSGVKAHLS